MRTVFGGNNSKLDHEKSEDQEKCCLLCMFNALLPVSQTDLEHCGYPVLPDIL